MAIFLKPSNYKKDHFGLQLFFIHFLLTREALRRMRVLWFSLMQIHCPLKENGPASEIISLISMRYLKWNAQF